ncbi:hypothetical protein FACS189430_04120 [Bacteroidia bacterium]|nr:hypothetical protein FACS189430_04120 [Bacteroidia bacterium]
MNYEYCVTWRKRDKNTYCRFHCDEINDLKKLDNICQDEIIISGLKQKEFELFCDNYADKFKIVQILHCNLIKDFSPFEKLQNVQFLLIDWNNKADKLWNMTKNISLKGLYLDDMIKITSLGGIETAPSLIGFSIEEDVNSKLYLDTLEPLALCHSLKNIQIRISGIKNGSALPITKMKSLEEAGFSCSLFETEQFAMLVSKLKNVKISPNVPYIIFNNNDKNNVLVVGKKRINWFPENSPKLKQYEAEWNDFLKKYE